MKFLAILFSLLFSVNVLAQTGKVTDDFLKTIETTGLQYYKLKKNGDKSLKLLRPNMIPNEKMIVFNGDHVQLISLGYTTTMHIPNAGYNGMDVTNSFAMLYAKKTNEDHLTYIGYYPAKKDQISIAPFKKFGAMYLKDYPQLASKVSKKVKGYTRYDAVAVFEEYDAWLNK